MTLERLTGGKSLCIHIETVAEPYIHTYVHDIGVHRTLMMILDCGDVVVVYNSPATHHPENYMYFMNVKERAFV